MTHLAERIAAILDLKGPSHARHNLGGALHDLERQQADPVCLRTIQRVMKQLAEVEKAISASPSPHNPD